jgi:DNA anti-recombination protein RmuC
LGAITLVAVSVQLIVILISLKIRTEQLEQRQDKTDNQIETVRLEMTKQISEVRSEMNQGFSDLRGEMNQRLSDMDTLIRQLNQNHIDHLTRHDS